MVRYTTDLTGIEARHVDLCCDAELEGYYRRFGMEPVLGMAIRRPDGPA